MLDIAAITAEPLLLAPQHAQTMLSALKRGAPVENADHRLDVAAVYGMECDEDDSLPFAFADGIAFVPVRGTLINRLSYSCPWVTGYKYLLSTVAAACANAAVRGIVFDVDSCGGEAAGCFETAEAIREMLTASGKPSVAVVDSNCYSAAYAMACAADRIVAIPSGGEGSIGVVCMHVDYSEMMGESGIKITYVYAGDHKVDGNPYQPLPDTVRADMQARIDGKYNAFVAHVASRRPMTEQAVRDTQARCFDSPAALALGLVDAVAPAQQAVAQFAESLTPAPMFGAVFMEADMADLTALAEARTAERARISAIMTCAEATGRGDLANHLAFETEMTAEQAAAMLSKAPRAAAATVAAATTPAEPNLLAAAMAAAGTPGISADASASASGASAEGDAAAATALILSSFASATGRKA
jgi:signal peptide peptidase SppA